MIKFSDLVKNPDPFKTYYAGSGISCELSPKQAYEYEMTASLLPVSDGIPYAGLDIAFVDENLSRFEFINFYFNVEFPTINTKYDYNIPHFYFYINTETGDDYIFRFKPSYLNDGYTGIENDTFTSTEFSSSNVESSDDLKAFIFDPANSNGWVGFTFNQDNIGYILDKICDILHETQSFPVVSETIEYVVPGNYQWVVPQGIKSARVDVVGAGGGSGGGWGYEVWGSAGHTGQIRQNVPLNDLKAGDVINVSVGLGGSGGPSVMSGIITAGSGQSSSIGVVTASGGSGGQSLGCFPPMTINKPDCSYNTVQGYGTPQYGRGADGTSGNGLSGNNGYIKLTYEYYREDCYFYDSIKRFGIKFYINNPDPNGPNYNTTYTLKIKDVEFNKTIEESKSTGIYLASTGPGRVYINGVKLN